MLAFFSPSGRAPPGRAVLVTAVAAAIAAGCIRLMQEGGFLFLTAAGAVGGATAAKLAVELARRRHDRGGSGAAVAAVLVAVALLVALAFVAIVPEPALYMVLAVAGAALCVVLFAPGERGANRHGPPPPGPLTASGVRPGAGGLAGGMAVTLLGAAIGLGIASLSNAMARHHEDIQRSLAAEGNR